ncbi:hypothetical protein BJY04DRAFT_181117 [Aspergillus karnatakaensis]|uniref:uncharacterized protein n=1 Tax=Aspergillus karnatakaensis TaxID=1810916 RepID=UPI003CCD40DC
MSKAGGKRGQLHPVVVGLLWRRGAVTAHRRLLDRWSTWFTLTLTRVYSITIILIVFNFEPCSCRPIYYSVPLCIFRNSLSSRSLPQLHLGWTRLSGCGCQYFRSSAKRKVR